MLVVVGAVLRVAMAVVNVIDVITVLNRRVAAPGAVLVVVLLGLDVPREVALVVVAVVRPVGVAVVKVVGVPTVLDRDVAAVRTVLVGMIAVRRASHAAPPTNILE